MEPHNENLGIDISDNVDNAFRQFLDIKKNDDDALVFQTYCLSSDKSRNIIHKLILQLEGQSNNGFAVYSYDDDDVNFDDCLYSCVFYHHAKSIYHEHEINHDSDAGLKALSSNVIPFVPEDIFHQDNSILQYYITQYEILFTKHYANELSGKNMFYDKVIRTFDALEGYFVKLKSDALDDEQIKRLEEALDNVMKELYSHNNKLFNIPFVYDALTKKKRCEKIIKILQKYRGVICDSLVKDLITVCDNARIEYTYCKTLLESKYNTEIRHDVVFTTQEIADIRSHKETEEVKQLLKRDTSRKIANNIRNSIRYIESIRQKCSYRTYELVDGRLTDADKFSRKARKLSLFLGILTIINFIIGIARLFH